MASVGVEMKTISDLIDTLDFVQLDCAGGLAYGTSLDSIKYLRFRSRPKAPEIASDDWRPVQNHLNACGLHVTFHVTPGGPRTVLNSITMERR